MQLNVIHKDQRSSVSIFNKVNSYREIQLLKSKLYYFGTIVPINVDLRISTVQGKLGGKRAK